MGRLVATRGMVLVGIGSAIGLVGGLVAARVVQGQAWLYGVSALDGPTLVGVVGCLAVVALLACLVPALRAAHTDPAEVMRAE